MTIDTIVHYMGQLKQLHESLLSLSRKKTEVLKSNDMNGLQKLLAGERKHVQAVNKVEKQRMQAVREWYQAQGLYAEDPTVSEMLEHLHGDEHVRLMEAYEGFIIVLADLKNQEQLNAELTQQSLQFITLSLDMLQPSLNNLNYGGSKQMSGADSAPKRSVFDSKA